jgi:hypothetical protein
VEQKAITHFDLANGFDESEGIKRGKQGEERSDHTKHQTCNA